MITINPKVCCIVDPYISSEAICDALLAEDIWPIAILTDQFDPARAEQSHRYSKDKFKKILYFNSKQEMSALVKELDGLNVLAVIAGNERTCNIADKIATQLTPTYANSPATSALRTDKFEMQNAMYQAGLTSIRQVKLSTPHISDEQQEAILRLGFPIILKPTNQSGSVGVLRCETLAELKTSLARALKKKNYFSWLQLFRKKTYYNSKTDVCVAQQCIEGVEYFVDTVSVAGQHKIVGIYRYSKVVYKQTPIYNFCETVDPASSQALECIDYVKKALSAAGLHYGMAHTELFLTAKGPRLVEINPRIAGAYGFIVRLASATLENNQAQLFVKSLIERTAFLSVMDQLSPLVCYGRIAFLQSWNRKRLRSFSIDIFKKMPSYQAHKLLKTVGEWVGPPKSLDDTVAVVLLAHPNYEQVKKDYDELFVLEKDDRLFT